LLLRLGVGGLMLFGHGIKKALRYATLSETFSDPLGIGAIHSLNLAIFAEVVCAAMVMIGLATRVAAVNVAGTMAVAAFIVHANDPWPKPELAVAYLVPFLVIALTGPGRFSIDRFRSKPA
jgi:putative oxidoreductase